MTASAALPAPDSQELRESISSAGARVVYRVLWEHQNQTLTMQEIRRLAAPLLSMEGLTENQEQLDRRRRQLNAIFDIRKARKAGETRYQLIGTRGASGSAEKLLSRRVRAQVLQFGRCAMCGRMPTDHGVVLVVDHKIPLAWGGTSDPENLQPLCEECNGGKKDHFASLAKHAAKIRQAVQYEEPHRRIGELLKAFGDEPVRTDLIGAVASAKQHQEDYQKRLRELRTLGWKIIPERRKGSGRTWTHYRLVHWEPWPQANIRGEITRREREHRKRR